MRHRRVLVARDGVLQQLEAVIDGVARGVGRAAIVEGPAGIGKSALVGAVSQYAVGAGMTVRTAAARELDAALPFAMFADALDLDPRGADPERAELGALLHGGGDAALDATQRRWRLISGIVDLLERDARTGPVLLVMEDLHWADGDSALAVSRIARALLELPIALIVTARPDPRPAPVTAAVRSLDDQGALRIVLTPLDDAAVRELATVVLGAPPTDGLVAGLARAAGNPLYVLQLLKALQEEGALEHADGGVDLTMEGVPPSLRVTIVRRLGYLPQETIKLLRHAAAMGGSSRLSWLAAVTGHRGPELTALLEPAFRSELLERGTDTVSFRHALIRDALYEDLPVATRAVLHAEIAQVLTGAGAPPSDVAVHLSRGLTPGDAAGASQLLEAAQALVESAPAAAAEYARTALDALTPAHPESLRARTVIAEAAARTGQPDQAETLASVLGDEQLDPRRRLGLWRTVTVARHMRGEFHPEDLEDYEALCRSSIVDVADRSEHLALLAFRYRWRDPQRARRLATEALEADTDDGTRALAFTALGLALLGAGEDSGYGSAERAVDLARGAGLGLSWIGIEALCALALIRSIEPDQAPSVLAQLRAALDAAEQQGLFYAVPALHLESARTHFFQGDFDAAETHANTALRLMVESGQRQNEADIRGMLCWIASERGHHEEAAAQRAQIAPGSVLASRATGRTRAREALRRGDAATAWELVKDEPVRAPGSPGGPSFGITWSLPAVEAAVAAGHLETARSWTAALDRWVDVTHANPVAVALATTARALCERTPDAARDAVAAVGGVAVFPLRLDGLRVAGEVFLEHGLHDEAVEVLKEGRALAHRAGATVTVAQYDALLRPLGVGHVAGGRPSRPDRGWDALTDAERRTVELIAAGYLYREIAEQLFISRRTVETQAAAALRKVGVPNRHELARVYRARQRTVPR